MSVWGASRILRLMARDNGEAGTGGQPPGRAFPKAFTRLELAQAGRIAPPRRWRRKSAFEQRPDQLFEFLERGRALQRLAVDEEEGRAGHLERVVGIAAAIHDGVLGFRIVLHAGLDHLLAEA